MDFSTQQDFRAMADDSRRLAAEHHRYSTLLEAIQKKPFPTVEDEVEAMRIKKMKLRLKDQMEALTHGRPSSMSVA